jgi:hypothetical protein
MRFSTVAGTRLARALRQTLPWSLAALAFAARAPAQTAPAAPAPAGAAESELSELEAALAADAQSTATAARPTGGTSAGASMNPDISVVLDVAGAYFSDAGHLQTGGHDPKANGFNLQQLELSLGSAVDPYFRFDANLVFSLFGVELEEAYGTTLDLPFGFQARAGQFLTRFGRINAKHPHAWNFVDQPFAIGRVFGSEGSRGLGLELSYLAPLPWYVELVASATGAAGEETARSFFGADDLGVESPADLLYVAAVKQFFPLSEDWSLFWGLSGAFGPNSSGRDNRTDVFGTDLYVKFRPITCVSPVVVALTSEWLYRRRQVPVAVLADTSGYTELFYRFVERWAVAGRYEYGSPSESVTGSANVADPLDPGFTADRHRLAANVTFFPSEFSRLRLQGSRDLPGWRDGVWAAFLALELAAGAHGAHTF